MTSHEQIEGKKWKKIFYFLMIMSFCNKLLGNSYVISAVKYFSTVLEDSESYEPVQKPEFLHFFDSKIVFQVQERRRYIEIN